MPGECAAKPKDYKEVYCINCKKTGHPASYRGCPTLIELKNRIENRQQSQQQNKHNRLALINRTTKPNLSFADAVKNNTNNPKVSYSKMEASIAESANDKLRLSRDDTDALQNIAQF